MKENPNSRLMAAVLDSIASGVILVDPDHFMVVCNRTFQTIWQIPPPLLATGAEQPILDFVAKQTADPHAFSHRVREIYTRPDESSSDLLHLADGRLVERFSVPYRVGHEYRGRIWTFHDVSRVAGGGRPECQISRADSVSLLAAAIAHDFSHLFQLIESQASWLLASTRMSPRESEAARKIVLAARRAGELTVQLRSFGVRSPAVAPAQNLNELVLRVIGQLQPVLPTRVELIFEPAPEEPSVACDANLIEQALSNLIWNASEAIVAASGQVRINTRLAEIDASRAREHPEARPGRYATLAVSDTGGGIDEFTLARIFKPFFTTKKAEKRAGLGLSKAQGIVQLHGGWIQVSSQLGYGSVFTMFLPAARQSEPDGLPAAGEGGDMGVRLARGTNGFAGGVRRAIYPSVFREGRADRLEEQQTE